MADRAIGTNCPKCSTLVACAGAHSDEVLQGQCPHCGASVQVANYNIANGEFQPVFAPARVSEEEAPLVVSDDDLMYEGPVTGTSHYIPPEVKDDAASS